MNSEASAQWHSSRAKRHHGQPDTNQTQKRERERAWEREREGGERPTLQHTHTLIHTHTNARSMVSKNCIRHTHRQHPKTQMQTHTHTHTAHTQKHSHAWRMAMLIPSKKKSVRCLNISSLNIFHVRCLWRRSMEHAHDRAQSTLVIHAITMRARTQTHAHTHNYKHARTPPPASTHTIVHFAHTPIFVEKEKGSRKKETEKKSKFGRAVSLGSLLQSCESCDSALGTWAIAVTLLLGILFRVEAPFTTLEFDFISAWFTVRHWELPITSRVFGWFRLFLVLSTLSCTVDPSLTGFWSFWTTL